jgi:hypothetical protein
MYRFVLVILLISNIMNNVTGQKRVQDAWFHSFLINDYAKRNIRKVAIFASLDTVIDKPGWAGVSPTININKAFKFNTKGDTVLQKSIIRQMEVEFERMGYDATLLNPAINTKMIYMQDLFDLANNEKAEALVILHYNVYRQWEIKADSATGKYWMENISEPEKADGYFNAGYLIMPNLYIYDVKSEEVIYRGLNYGNNGKEEGGFYLSEQSAPVWKKEASENSVKSIINFGQSGYISKNDQVPYYSIPVSGGEIFKTSVSGKKESFYRERSISIVPYVGYFPLEYGITLNRVYDSGNHKFNQWSVAVARTVFTQTASVFSVYSLYEFGNDKAKWLYKRFSTRTGVVFGFGVGGKQLYTETMRMQNDTFVNQYSSTIGRLLLGMTFQMDYLLTQNIAISLRAMPGMDVHFYYPDSITLNFEDERTDKESGIAQKYGIPLHLGINWYFR